jgi:hypothetical protein
MGEVEEIVETPVVEEEKTPEPLTMTLQMLENMRNLVEVSVGRGAFRPNELSSVGKIYDEFVASLDSIKKSKA